MYSFHSKDCLYLLDGLEALISLESSKRLAALGGSEKKIRMPRRRRPEE